VVRALSIRVHLPTSSPCCTIPGIKVKVEVDVEVDVEAEIIDKRVR